MRHVSGPERELIISTDQRMTSKTLLQIEVGRKKKKYRQRHIIFTDIKKHPINRRQCDKTGKVNNLNLNMQA